MDGLLEVMLSEPYATQAAEANAAATAASETEAALAAARGQPAPPEAAPDYSGLQQALLAGSGKGEAVLKPEAADWLDQPQLRPAVEPLVQEAIERHSAEHWEDLLANGKPLSAIVAELCVDVITTTAAADAPA